MANWSFEVRHGKLESIPSSVAEVVVEQRRQRTAHFVIAEAGNLLNEPDRKIVRSIGANATGADAIANVAEACAWLFGMFEVEVDRYFQSNYLKLTFVNLAPRPDDETAGTGKITTNAAELPAPVDQPPELIVHQIVTMLRVFFTELQGCVEDMPSDANMQLNGWVSLVFNRA